MASSEPATTNQAPKQQADRTAFEVDILLQHLVQLANATGVGPAVTLNLGGMLICGLLVGGKEYAEGVAAQFREEHSGTDASGIAERFAEFYEGMIPRYEEIADRVKNSDPAALAELPVYIHLKRAQALTPGLPGTTPTDEGVWWRGRIASVDGFSIGVLAQTAAAEPLR